MFLQKIAPYYIFEFTVTLVSIANVGLSCLPLEHLEYHTLTKKTKKCLHNQMEESC